MSKYTTEVRFICESLAGRTESAGVDNVNSIINTAAPLLFNFDFPIFDESYRLPLEAKILRHYYTREICEETVGLWKLRLQDKLNMIMPYYNQLYRSELLKFNPLYDVDITTERNKTNESEANKTVAGEIATTISDTKNKTDNRTTNYTDNVTSGETTDGTGWELYSDTPQGGVAGINGSIESIENNYYLTNATKNTNDIDKTATSNGQHNETNSVEINENTSKINNSTNNTQTNSDITDTETYIEHITGKKSSISYAKMLQDFRKTFINIDLMLIEDLSGLFFGLWE